MWLFILNWCPDHRLILRGCSSKRKMFHIECESHMSGTRCICHFCHISNTRKLVTQTQTVSWHHIYSFLFGSTINNTDMLLTSRKEQFCYCSFDLCNEGSSGRIEAFTILSLTLPLLAINLRWPDFDQVQKAELDWSGPRAEGPRCSQFNSSKASAANHFAILLYSK